MEHVGYMSKNNNFSGVGKLLLFVMLILGMGAVGLWFYDANLKQTLAKLGNANTTAVTAAQAASDPYEPIFLELAPFTVTLHNEIKSRVLYAGITLRLADEDSKTRLIRYLPVVRSRILHQLSHMDPTRLNDPKERDQMRLRITDAVSAPITPELHRQSVDETLFTTFVVQ